MVVIHFGVVVAACSWSVGYSGSNVVAGIGTNSLAEQVLGFRVYGSRV